MKILGIETSCDETSIAIVENGTKILSNVVASSLALHTETGGIIPEVAARQQIKSILPVLKEAEKESKIKSIKSDVDAIAVTIGPGLIGSLLVGVETARTLSYLFEKPLIPVNHLVAHLYANWLKKENLPSFPALALVVYGGHTDLVLMKNHGKITWIGGTRDDAAGEAFDKCARLLGLPYPGGPSIAKASLDYKKDKDNPSIKFPRPMMSEDNFDWSFSGLKTAVLREVDKLGGKEKLDKETVAQLSFEIQEAICEVLVEKTLKAVNIYQPKSLILGGGVSANSRLKERFLEEIKNREIKVDFYSPSPQFSTDNAASIASFAFYNYSPTPWKKIEVNPTLTILGE
jgi:N6-L-threonylcarbamoyladenine synthase